MAELVLFHHIRGLTPGVAALADRWREAGHVVHTPDLFAGRTFDSIEGGSAYADDVGFDTLLTQAREAVEAWPPHVVYAGISMGAMAAEYVALTRPGARGVVMLEGAVPVGAFAELGAPARWPDGVPFQIHGMDEDPFFAGEGGIELGNEMLATLRGGELFTYPGAVHLFCDASMPEYDAGATEAVVASVAAFLARLDGG